MKFPTLASSLVWSAVLSCGGRQSGLDLGDPDGASPASPAPDCNVVCAYLIGSCAPGASIGPCVSDCDSNRQQHASCPEQLDDYLRCAAMSEVQCSTDKVVITGCSDEFERLAACGPASGS